MNAALHTPICEPLGCRHPVLQAGMGGVARASLAAAVIESGVDAVVYFWDVDSEAVRRARGAGLKVLYQVGSVADAMAAEAAGVDAIIAQGVEAGGHVRGTLTSLVLLPQVVRAVSIPVIGSGGFATGSDLVAALALGGEGIHCGTAFVATFESFAHELHKRNIVAARSEDTLHTDAFAINWPPHSPVRVLRNAMTGDVHERPFGHDAASIPREQVAEEDGRPVYLWSTDSPLQSMSGDLERLAQFAGQVSGRIVDVPTAGQRVIDIVREAEAVLGNLFSRNPG